MPRKSNRPPRSGVGGFPTNAPTPVLISLYHPPIHTSDYWEAAGRPFWCVRYTRTAEGWKQLGIAEAFARTLTPTFCPLALVATVPMYAYGVYVGACGRWEPAEWQERRDYRAAARDVSRYLKYNPVSQVSWDATLSAGTVQTYAAAGDIGSASDLPVSPVREVRKMSFEDYAAEHGFDIRRKDGDYTELGGEA